MDCLGQQSGVQSVQNLENVINEGLRAALLAETPDQSLDVLLQHLGMALDGVLASKQLGLGYYSPYPL